MLEKIAQETHYLIGTKQALSNLENKDHARLLVISDSHNRYITFKNIVLQFGKTCDALIFCGDGIGDLVHLLSETLINEELKNSTPSVIAFARGNGDPSSYPLNMKESIYVPNSQILKVNGRNFLIVHGHREEIDYGMENLGLAMQLADCKTAFYGHSHIAKEENIDGYKFVNPGSCARPRGGQPAGFAIATVEKNFVDIAFLKEINQDGKQGFTIWNPIF